MNQTVGLSPKAILAAVLPAAGGLVAIAVQWIATGTLDRNELATAIGAVIASLLAFAGAWAGSPGDVRPSVPPYSGTTYGERGLALIEVVVILLVIGFLWLAIGSPGR